MSGARTREQAESAGHCYPLGATLTGEGANFSIYSRTASGIELLFFDSEDNGRSSRIFRLDPYLNRTYHYWHISVPGVQPGQIYAYRAHGSFSPSNGLRFDASKLLLDPYSHRVVVPKTYSREAASNPGDNTACAMKNMVVDFHSYDWENDRPLRTPSSRTIIYEMHVAGFTRNPNSGVTKEIENEGISFYLILNAYWKSLTFELPEVDVVSCGPWRRWVDTSLDMPDDIVEWQRAVPVPGDLYHSGPRSTVVLIASQALVRNPTPASGR